MKTPALVCHKFTIDEDLLLRLSQDEGGAEGYFTRSLTFYESVFDKDVRDISLKQAKWLWDLERILHDRKQRELSTLDHPGKTSRTPAAAPIQSYADEPKTFYGSIRSAIRKFLYGAP